LDQVLPEAAFQAIVVTPSSCERRTPPSTSAGTAGPSPTQAPLWHASFAVQEFASLQPVPSGAAGFEQTPVPESQVPAAWHTSLAAHTTGLPPEHAPDAHVSVRVQALPSLQPVPSGASGFEQTPDGAEHVPAVWQASLGVHTTGWVPTHVPD
jgi:hypothetical protein